MQAADNAPPDYVPPRIGNPLSDQGDSGSLIPWMTTVRQHPTEKCNRDVPRQHGSSVVAECERSTMPLAGSVTEIVPWRTLAKA